MIYYKDACIGLCHEQTGKLDWLLTFLQVECDIMLRIGVDPKRIIFANPCKRKGDILFAKVISMGMHSLSGGLIGWVRWGPMVSFSLIVSYHEFAPCLNHQSGGSFVGLGASELVS